MTTTAYDGVSALAMLQLVRDELVAFTRQVLLEGHPPDPNLSQPAVLPSAFEEAAWRDSPLLRPYRTGLNAWLAEAIDWFGSGESMYCSEPYRESPIAATATIRPGPGPKRCAL